MTTRNPIAFGEGLYQCPRCGGSVFRDRLDGDAACLSCARRFYKHKPVVQDESQWWRETGRKAWEASRYGENKEHRRAQARIQAARIRTALAAGATVQETAARLGVSKRTVYRAMKAV